MSPKFPKFKKDQNTEGKSQIGIDESKKFNNINKSE
jgi:hypothetical protein